MRRLHNVSEDVEEKGMPDKPGAAREGLGANIHDRGGEEEGWRGH